MYDLSSPTGSWTLLWKCAVLATGPKEVSFVSRWNSTCTYTSSFPWASAQCIPKSLRAKEVNQRSLCWFHRCVHSTRLPLETCLSPPAPPTFFSYQQKLYTAGKGQKPHWAQDGALVQSWDLPPDPERSLAAMGGEWGRKGEEKPARGPGL